jgi:hypothetical protein
MNVIKKHKVVHVKSNVSVLLEGRIKRLTCKTRYFGNLSRRNNMGELSVDEYKKKCGEK